MTQEENYLRQLIAHRLSDPKQEKWTRGAFKDIKALPTTQIGQIAEDFVLYLGEQAGHEVSRPESRRGEYDVAIGGKRFEVKGATEDASGYFQFNGVRTDTKFDFLLVIGVAPDAALFNAYRRKDLLDMSLVSMRKGANSDFKLTRAPAKLRSIGEFNVVIAACISIGKPPPMKQPDNPPEQTG